MAYGQPIMIQVQPQQPKQSGFHPILIIIFVIVVLLVVGTMYLFLDKLFTPLATATGNTINLTPATNTLHFAETSVDYGIILIVLILGFADAIWQRFHPNKIFGIFNIAFLFALGFIWLVVKIPFLAVVSGIGVNTIFPTLYAFVASGYFVLILAVCLIIGIIFDFYGE
jgi:hypothetical protein